MKKFLILCMVAMIFLSSCSWFEPKEDSAQQKDENKNIKAIDSLSSYSSIGAGLVNEDSRAFGNGKMKMLGIKKHSGEASVIHFVNENGNVISEDHYFTASLTSDTFSFYKIMFKDIGYIDFAYEGNNFEAAAGELYCLNNENGSIYKLEGVQSMNAGFGEYDCYNNVFVGSFKFQTGETLLCKVYVDNGELKIEKKLNLDDFPEFKHIFMDAKENIFAYDDTYLDNIYHWGFPVKYILSNNDKVYSVPNFLCMLGFNRVVYNATGQYQYGHGERPDENNVQTMKALLEKHYLIETGTKAGEYSVLNSNFFDVEPLEDGKIKVTAKSEGYDAQFNGVWNPVFKDIDLAVTADFIPPELAIEHWNSCMHGPYMNWGYSKLLGNDGETYYYITRCHTQNGIEYTNYVNKITFTNKDHSTYTMEDVGDSNRDSTWGDYITDDFAYGNGKIFYLRSNVLRVVDLKNETNTVFANPIIVRYHSIERADNNEVMFVGTNTSAEKMYYKINTDTMEISLIGTNPTFSSVSFHPISVTD